MTVALAQRFSRNVQLTVAALLAATMFGCASTPTVPPTDLGSPPEDPEPGSTCAPWDAGCISLPAAFIRMTVTPAANAQCVYASNGPQDWLALGNAWTPIPSAEPAGTGASSSVPGVSVMCTVHPTGTGFDIDLRALQPWTSAAIQITSTPDGGVVTDAGADGGLSAIFTSSSDMGSAQLSAGGGNLGGGCAITYTYQGQVVPACSDVGPGHVWGHISCPLAWDGVSALTHCDVEADFLFENCQE